MADEHFKALKKDESHVTGEANGCLWRCGRSGHKHRENGKKYLESNKGKLSKYYDHDFTCLGSAARERFDAVQGAAPYGEREQTDPRYNKTLWHIGDADNFGPGDLPWLNNAHHILPCAAVRNAFCGIGEFEILLKGKYNINCGENIVYLPKKELDGQLMEMVTHPGSHPAYNAALEGLIETKIRPKIKKAADKESEGHGPLEEKDIPKIRDVISSETENIMINTLDYGSIGAGITVNKFDPSWTKK